jgi:hypothetical protein
VCVCVWCVCLCVCECLCVWSLSCFPREGPYTQTLAHALCMHARESYKIYTREVLSLKCQNLVQFFQAFVDLYGLNFRPCAALFLVLPADLNRNSNHPTFYPLLVCCSLVLMSIQRATSPSNLNFFKMQF